MKRVYFILLIIIGLFSLFLSFTPSFAQPPVIPSTPVSPDEHASVENAIYQAIAGREVDHIATTIFQTRVMDLVFAPDSQWARAWLISADPITGETAPIEPGLAVVHKENGGWTVYLQPDITWLNAIQKSPNELFPPEEKNQWIDMYQQVQVNMPTSPLTGYRLPWKAGQTRSLSQSVLHDKYDASLKAHYAFDFYVHDTLWEIYAAKSGTVFLFKDDVPTCYENHCDGQGSGNYIVLKDTTTNPTSYMLYLHLAQNSIPSNLKVIGTPVTRGQFIGIADNTGASYGDHLHFMVHTFPGWWGQSVDITFDDVLINGGRPRVKNQFADDEPYCLHTNGFNDVCDNFQTDYVSHNVPCETPDFTPPNGALTAPITDGVSITGSVNLAGWGIDTECGLGAGQFIANYDGTWKNIGPAFSTSPFSYTWNLCDVPDGPVEVGLRLTDQAVNSIIVGAHSLSKDYTCPAPPVPACIPNDNEIMLFDSNDYTGSCIPFSPGDYPDLGSFDNKASAILVGASVQATLFDNTNYTGRGETFFSNDNNLIDNIIGADSANSLRVNWRSQASLAPILQSPLSGSNIPKNDVVTLFWENGGFTTDYQIAITGSITSTYLSNWQREPYLHLDGLPEGQYTWQVRGRNPMLQGPWSSLYTFTISNTNVIPPPSITAPFTDTMESTPSNWLATGFWHLVDDVNLAHRGTYSWWYQNADGNYNNGQPNSGDLTSPQFNISTKGHYFLRFYYRYTTETHGPDWDQRWVEISYNDGPFYHALPIGGRQQLTDDPYADELSDPYLSSQVYDLGVLGPGQSVRVRFHFDTLDAVKNNYQGWAIDDVGITTNPPVFANDPNEPNDTPQQATPITSGESIDGVIQSKGDVDYFVFTAPAGERMVADIDAQILGSLLDPYLFLLDSDGKSILAQNDDEVYGQVRDSFLTFYAPHTGTYYLKLRAWNNPGVGGNGYYYTLHFYLDNNDPVLNFPSPVDEAGYINSQVVSLAAFANDTQSGISRLDFYFHDSDWINHNWELLGSDADGSNGWSIPFNRPDQHGAALYVKAFDRSRNMTGQGYWNLPIDRTPPQTALLPLSITQTSTAFKLEWSGSDNLSGIDSYKLQWSIDSGSWVNYPLTFTGYTQSTWIIGIPGHIYAFRIQGIDRAGNIENFTQTAETSTHIPMNICTLPDTWEVDNTFSSASPIIRDQLQAHNFCNPETMDGLNDLDWIKFSAVAGQRYLILASPTAENTAATISVYTSDGITLTLRSEMSQTVWGKPANVDWLAEKTEVLYIKIHHTDGRVAGNYVTYEVHITLNHPIYLPFVFQRP